MKKIIIIFVAALIVFILGIKLVNAKTITSLSSGEVSLFAGGMTESEASNTCKHLFGDPTDDGYISGTPSLAYYLQKALDIIKYLGIVICIVLTIVDFAKALFSNDKDMLKPLSKKAISRLIYAVILFFLPIIVKTLLTIVGAYGTCGIK